MNLKNLKYNKKIKLFYSTDDNSDEIAIKESKKNYLNYDFSNKTCLDIGANIGAFTAIALNSGANKVISIEPDTRKFKILSHNFDKEKKVKLINGAASNKNGKIKIYKNNSKQSSISVKTGDVVNKNSSYVVVNEVKAYDIYTLIDKHLPHVLKVDIEGAEFICFADKKKKINKCVKEMFLEIHLTKEHKKDMLDHVFKQFKQVKFKKNISFGKVVGYDVYLKR